MSVADEQADLIPLKQWCFMLIVTLLAVKRQQATVRIHVHNKYINAALFPPTMSEKGSLLFH